MIKRKYSNLKNVYRSSSITYTSNFNMSYILRLKKIISKLLLLYILYRFLSFINFKYNY